MGVSCRRNGHRPVRSGSPRPPVFHVPHGPRRRSAGDLDLPAARRGRRLLQPSWPEPVHATVPTVFDPSSTALFPLDFTFWSLFFELVANLVYAALAPRLSNRLLGIIVAIGFLGLVASGLVAGSLSNGTLRATFLGGLARVTFGFFAGVRLFRLWLAGPQDCRCILRRCSCCWSCRYCSSRVRHLAGCTNWRWSPSTCQ